MYVCICPVCFSHSTTRNFENEQKQIENLMFYIEQLEWAKNVFSF